MNKVHVQLNGKKITLFQSGGQWRRDFWDSSSKKSIPYYFGNVKDDPTGEQAMAEFLDRHDAIKNGTDRMRVQGTSKDLTLLDLARRFLDAQQEKLNAGTLADETYADYRREVDLFGEWVGNDSAVVHAFGPDHFAGYAKHLRSVRKLGVDRQATVIRYIRAMFNHAAKQKWIPAPAFGVEFSAPNTSPEAKSMQAGRDGKKFVEERIYRPREIRLVLKALKGAASGPIKIGDHTDTFVSNPNMYAMVLLSLNAGMGPKDIARLKWTDINMETGRLSSRRGKTGIRREAYLWKKTRDALAALPRKGELLFYTKDGLPYVRSTRKEEGGRVKIKTANAVSITYGRLLKRLGIEGVTFYDLRHTCRTVMDNSTDMNAARRVMGKMLLGGSDARYVRGPLKLVRLKRLAKLVHRYVWPKDKKVKPLTSGMRLVGVAA